MLPLKRTTLRPVSPATVPWLLCGALLVACSGGGESEGDRRGGGRPGGGPPGAGFGGERPAAAVPIEVTAVERRDIASYIETNGTLEAEKEVDLVARTAGPIVDLRGEENQAVQKGQVLARLDEDEIRARLEISRVALQEAETEFARAEELQRASLISGEEFDQARNRLESARAEFRGNEIQIGYTVIRAPFSGLIVERYVKFAETVNVNQPLFRISDFDPLLCLIQVPERELSRLAVGQSAYLEVDAWSGERFEAQVLRLSPVVDAATGTIKVTLEVEGKGKLRPGMFASVFLQTETHVGALVIPKSALALDSIGDAVFVAEEGSAARRDVTLGVREGDFVEVVAGLSEGDAVISVGQDSLSDGTPIELVGDEAPGFRRDGRDAAGDDPPAGGGADSPGRPGNRTAGSAAPDPERLEMMRQRMRDGGMSDEQIEERVRQMKQSSGSGSGSGQGGSAEGGEAEGTSESAPDTSDGEGR